MYVYLGIVSCVEDSFPTNDFCCVARIRIWLVNIFFFFFAKIGILCKSIAGPLIEAKTHWMVNWLQLLNQLNWTLYDVITRCLCKIRLNDVLEMFDCWERRNPPRSIWASSEKIIFFLAKIGILCKSIAGPLSEAKTHWMINWIQLLNQLNWTLYAVIPRSLCKIHLNDVSEMFDCWERRNPPRLKWTSSEKMIFFLAKIGIFCKSIAGPLSEAKTHWMINWIQLLNQLNWTLYAVIPRSLCKIRLNDVSEMLRCCERRGINVNGAWHTLSAKAAILSGVRTVFGRSQAHLTKRIRNHIRSAEG